jgi:hypothetical protein
LHLEVSVVAPSFQFQEHLYLVWKSSLVPCIHYSLPKPKNKNCIL